MNTEQTKGSLEWMKGEIQKKWGQLTDDDLKEFKGNWHVFAGQLRKKLDISQDDADRQVSDFVDKLNKGLFGGTGQLENGIDFLKEQAEHLKENVSQASEKVVNYVKEKPMASLGIALLAGVLLAVIARR